MGLRRGFIQTGTQNLLMTLWPISDEIAVQIMSDFYELHTNRERSGGFSFSRGATQLAIQTAHRERASPSGQSCRAIYYEFSRQAGLERRLCLFNIDRRCMYLISSLFPKAQQL